VSGQVEFLLVTDSFGSDGDEIFAIRILVAMATKLGEARRPLGSIQNLGRQVCAQLIPGPFT
jgi:hypothetical protein